MATLKHRLYIDSVFSVGQTIQLNSSSSHYLGAVLRLTENQAIELFNGHQQCLANIIAKDKKTTTLQVNQILDSTEAESPLQLSLAMALIQSDRFDWVVQKATELGIKQIYPLFTRYGKIQPKRFNQAEKKLAHWQKIAIAASEQSERIAIPKIHPPQSLSEFIDSHQQQINICLHTATQSTELCNINAAISVDVNADINAIKSSENWSYNLLIGPEGGWHPQEIEQLTANQCHTIQLGKRILRAETAAISAITLAQFHWGDLH